MYHFICCPFVIKHALCVKLNGSYYFPLNTGIFRPSVLVCLDYKCSCVSRLQKKSVNHPGFLNISPTLVNNT